MLEWEVLLAEVVNVGQNSREDEVSTVIPYISSSSVQIPVHDRGWNLTKYSPEK